MGNILIDMMGLLSRKRVVKTYDYTDMLVLGRRPNADDSIFNTPKMHNELISIKDLRAQFDTGEVTEYVYQTAGHAKRKAKQIMNEGVSEFVVATAEQLHYLRPEFVEDYDDPLA